MEKPILFNTEMVKAILEGRKTVTRRVIKCAGEYINCDCSARFSYDKSADTFYCTSCGYPAMKDEEKFLRPPYRPGDTMWVRETWAEVARIAPKANQLFADVLYAYKADGEHELVKKWRPSIHMPREAARIFLRVTDVRVERLQDISAEHIQREGIMAEYTRVGDVEVARGEFRDLWYSTVKPEDRDRYGWEANPWVWVIELERIEKEESKRG